MAKNEKKIEDMNEEELWAEYGKAQAMIEEATGMKRALGQKLSTMQKPKED